VPQYAGGQYLRDLGEAFVLPFRYQIRCECDHGASMNVARRCAGRCQLGGINTMLQVGQWP
jgi:hypothetical protein